MLVPLSCKLFLYLNQGFVLLEVYGSVGICLFSHWPIDHDNMKTEIKPEMKMELKLKWRRPVFDSKTSYEVICFIESIVLF